MKYKKEPELTGRIVLPNDPLYNSARQEFNTFFNKFPLIIVFAKETQDVINAIRWARYTGVPLRMRSGRHNYEGVSALDGGLIIDVSEMKELDINRKRGTVTLQTGFRNFEIVEDLGSQGLVVPPGLCPTPGIAGVTLGGGHSSLSRPWGLVIDNLLEAELVDADGCVLHASAEHNADLFWALRGGGGGNFGVCTSFRFRTHEIDTVAYAAINWGIEDLKPVLKVWQEYTLPGADNRFTPLLSIISGEQSFLLAQGVFLGSARELRKLLCPLLRSGSPSSVFIEDIPWVEAAARIGVPQLGIPVPFKSVGPYLDALLPDEAIGIIERFITNPPTSAVSLLFHGLGGAVADIPSKATAYFQRKALSNMSIYATWNEPEGAGPGIHWVDQFRREMLPYTNGVYINTQDLSIKNWPKAYYGGNFERLTRIKAEYDPENFFRFPQSIPPTFGYRK